jgi:hypothetical protein
MQWKRWAGAGIAGVCVALYVLLARDSMAWQGESCGLGLPPGAPGYAAAQAREEAETRENGFLRVCGADLERFRISFKPIDVAARGLAFLAVDLTQTPFAQFESLGGKAEAVSGKKSRLYRGFRMPDGHTVTLFEHDMSVDGSNSWRDTKDQPERVNGLPARLGVFQTNAGKAVSLLSWTEGRRSYELWIDANAARQPLREQLFKLAASLPASVPACPNEPPPRPVRLGADGRLLIEPLPDVLTEEEFKARFESERPCK